MTKKLLLLTLTLLALLIIMPLALANNVMLQVQGTLTDAAGTTPQSTKAVSINVQNQPTPTWTATTDSQGQFSVFVATEAEVGSTVYLEFKVDNSVIGTFPVIAGSPHSVSSLQVTQNFQPPITLGTYMVKLESNDNEEKTIGGEWDFCYLSAWRGSNLGNSPTKGCGVAPTNRDWYHNVIPIQDHNVLETHSGLKTWKIKARAAGNAEIWCAATCVRFRNN